MGPVLQSSNFQQRVNKPALTLVIGNQMQLEAIEPTQAALTTPGNARKDLMVSDTLTEINGKPVASTKPIPLR